ncbi:MAG TPA: GNAT family N-acetyltransferase [Candidatus Acidoferrales bacterium]|nr:GNAT family N-acetyltransferase [Candidatus Acidoferrales bacterium]
MVGAGIQPRYNPLAGRSLMEIVPLRQTTPRQLDPLFEEEADRWLQDFRWDYRPSLALIRRFVETRSLDGCAAFEEDRVAGYGFYVFEEEKALLGGLFVARSAGDPGLPERLLAALLLHLRTRAEIGRIEAQLIPFGHSLDLALEHHRFRLHKRQFMYLDLDKPRPAASPASGLRLERWTDRCFEPCARLIERAYSRHVDSDINEQYRSEGGASRFLRNVVLLPGCGQFLPEASLVIPGNGRNELQGVVLTSVVAPRVAHITQICLLPSLQGKGLGRSLLEASIAALQERHFEGLSLTVTSSNAPAVQLYATSGFRVLRTFSAAVWDAKRQPRAGG